jgi:hypothetical protein
MTTANILLVNCIPVIFFNVQVLILQISGYMFSSIFRESVKEIQKCSLRLSLISLMVLLIAVQNLCFSQPGSDPGNKSKVNGMKFN